MKPAFKRALLEHNRETVLEWLAQVYWSSERTEMELREEFPLWAEDAFGTSISWPTCRAWMRDNEIPSRTDRLLRGHTNGQLRESREARDALVEMILVEDSIPVEARVAASKILLS